MADNDAAEDFERDSFVHDGKRRTMLRKFTPTRVPSAALRKEFGLNPEFGDLP